jgi:hypothetical protein
VKFIPEEIWSEMSFALTQGPKSEEGSGQEHFSLISESGQVLAYVSREGTIVARTSKVATLSSRHSVPLVITQVSKHDFEITVTRI